MTDSIGGIDAPQLDPGDVARFQIEAVRRLILVLDAAEIVSRRGFATTEEEWGHLRGAVAAAPRRMAQLLQASLAGG